jgi:hypothetical protein
VSPSVGPAYHYRPDALTIRVVLHSAIFFGNDMIAKRVLWIKSVHALRACASIFVVENR